MAEPFREYLFEYPHDGGTWALKVKARDPDDARERLKALAWARYKGEVAATIPVPSLLGRVLARILPRR
ncbi:hypothetical protein [Methylobacterium sp.]|jgi:hypothetical protein|uniref:hypothetical protein n=1 Tax=Methylobacterium sp. TaxID=409 RepID=UPI0025E0AAEF|nr:hypothetical protein [Methylobacterium sp.]MBY0258543.1 hypothetical protein [Methylobacterium sp.]